MKSSIVFALLIVASCGAASTRKSQLAQDFDEFSSLFPKTDIIALAFKYYTSDDEFRSFVVYLMGNEAKEAWRQLFNHQEIRKIVEYLESQGVDTIAAINSLADLAGFPHYPELRGAAQPRSVRKFFNEVEALIPFDKLKELFYEKLENSQAFKDLYNKIAAFNYKEFFQFVEESKEMTAVLKGLREFGLKVDAAIEKLRKLFQWN